MNHTIVDHMDSFLNEISPNIKTYKITIKQNGKITQWEATGKDMSEAENSILDYVGRDIDFLGCKDITDEAHTKESVING